MDGPKTPVNAKAAAVALLFFLSLSIAHELGQAVSVHPNQTEAAGTHYNYGTPFEVILFANATTEEKLWCNASITLNEAGINFTISADRSNTTYLGNISSQSVSNATWSLNATGRGAHYLNFSLACNGTAAPLTANTTIYVDLLNITSVNITPSTYAIKWNDSYLGVYRDASYNISVTVANIVPAQTLTNATVYLNGTGSSPFNLGSGTNTTIFAQYNASAPAGSISEYTITANDSQGDRWSQPLVIRVLSPLNASIAFNDSKIVVNQSFTVNATATNFGPLNLTSVNLTLSQYDGNLTLITNASCQLFNLTPSIPNPSCIWTFNATGANAGASINITGTSAEGDNNTYPFSARIYGWGSFTANASISFGTQNHSNTAIQSVILNASAAEDLVNFNCTAAGEFTGVSCLSLSNLSKSATVPLNITLTIPQYTSKGIHSGNVSIYAENANPFVVNYSVNVTGMKKCGLTSPVSATRTTGASTTGLAAVNITNQGNVNITTVSCGSSGCSQIQSPSSPLTPGNSAIYNISATPAALTSTSTTFLVNCSSSDTDAIDGGTSNNLTITHPSGESSSTTTTTTTSNTQAPQVQQNVTTYTYTVGILPATVTLKKGESADFTVEVKNTGTGALANLTVSGEATLQFSVTPTKIVSIARGQSGYSKITITTISTTASGEYKVKAKVCRTATSCITSVESTITIPADTQPANTTQNISANNTTNIPPAAKNATLNITTENNSINLQINATNATNVTAYVEVLDNSGKVVYNSTVKAEAANGSAIYNISLPQTLKAGNYTLKVALKDFAGNTLAEKNVSYTAKANDIPKKTSAAAITSLLTPNIVNGLLIVIMALFIIAGIKTSKIGTGGAKSTVNIRQKMLEKAQSAYKQGEYAKAKEYKATAESASKTERELMQKIAGAEQRILQLYKEGAHLQARKEQDSLARMKKELEILREQKGK